MNWIKCSDRMPEKGDSILAYGQIFSIYSEEKPDKDEKFVIEKCTYDLDYEECNFIYNYHCCPEGLLNVTHWMPLPSAPSDLRENGHHNECIPVIYDCIHAKEGIKNCRYKDKCDKLGPKYRCSKQCPVAVIEEKE